MSSAKPLTGWRYAALVGALVGGIGLASYPIIISPMMNPEPYQKIQRETRRGIKQEDIQPGNMKVWTDPFGRKKKSENQESEQNNRTDETKR